MADSPRTVEQIITYLEEYLAQMRRDPERNQLTGVDPDTAFELGYETAIFDIRHANDQGPEVGIIEFPMGDAEFPPDTTDTEA